LSAWTLASEFGHAPSFAGWHQLTSLSSPARGVVARFFFNFNRPGNRRGREVHLGYQCSGSESFLEKFAFGLVIFWATLCPTEKVERRFHACNFK
jgi:hypothetical protein